MERPYEYIFVDEAGFNLTKTRGRDRNIFGHRAIASDPCQRGATVTLWAAVTNSWVLYVMPPHGHVTPTSLLRIWVIFGMPYLGVSRQSILSMSSLEQGQFSPWWPDRGVAQHQPSTILPFAQPSSRVFSTACRWKIYDRQPYTGENLMQAI